MPRSRTDGPRTGRAGNHQSNLLRTERGVAEKLELAARAADSDQFDDTEESLDAVSRLASRALRFPGSVGAKHLHVAIARGGVRGVLSWSS